VELEILKIGKTPLIYSISYFNLGGWEFCFGGITAPKPPMVTRLVLEQLNDEVALELAHEICV